MKEAWIFHWCLTFAVVWNFSSLSALPSLWNSAAFPTSWKALGGGISALLLVTPPLSSRVQAWRVECNMWHLQFSMAYCLLIMVWRFCAAMVVLWAWKTCRVPISFRLYPFTQRGGSTSTSSCTLPNLSAWLLQGGSQPSLFLPPAPLSWEQEARPSPAAAGHWMVGEFGSSSPDWWMACPTYLSRTDAALAAAHRLSLLTLLSEPDL